MTIKIIIKRIIIGIGILSATAAISIGVMAYSDSATANQAHIFPDYPKEDLGLVLSHAFDAEGKINLSEADYKRLLYQTGLGRPSVDEILRDAGHVDSSVLAKLEKFQTDFFAPIHVASNKIGIITFEEKIVDGSQNEIKGFDFARIKRGDILIHKSSHSTGWRHGHSAIVIDAENQKTVEAILLGYNSTIQSMDKWRSYPTFMLLRLKDDAGKKRGLTPEKIAEQAADFSLDYGNDVPYGLFSGLFDKADGPDSFNQTQCAHLVWNAYEYIGFDIDSDGGWLVTPKDIANSDLLEIVQIYGVDPEEIWP